MDFSAISQIRAKKFWWMDVIFYFVVSLLIATLLCYLIFLVKNNFQKEDIRKEIIALQTVGTNQQKEYEREVINYQKKISEFSNLLKNHEFASNVFAFMQIQTMPNVWFKQFSLDEKNNGVQLSGESDNMDAFSRQVATFEKSEHVKDVVTLNSVLGQSERVDFSIKLSLDQNIFSYLATAYLIPETVLPSEQLPSIVVSPVVELEEQASSTISSEKSITSFRFLLNPEVAGTVDETNHEVVLDVPYGTNVKNLTSSIVMSPGATILPASGVSQDFTSPVTYIVTAQDGSVQNYQVKVNVGAPPIAKESSSQESIRPGFVALIIVVFAAVVVIAGVFLLIRKKK